MADDRGAMIGHYLANLLRHGRIDPVEYYPCPQYRAVYVENAKVACTAIKQTLYPDVSYAALGQERFHQQLRRKAHLAPPPGTQDYLYFTFVRDPLARFLSCYQDKIANTAAHGEPGIFHTRFHRALHVLFSGTDTARPGLPADRFAQAVAHVPNRLRDRHVMSQAPIFAAVQAATHGFVGHYEKLAQDWAALASRTGLPPLPALNRSQSTQGPQAAGPILSAPAQALLVRTYAADFTLLGYQLPEYKA